MRAGDGGLLVPEGALLEFRDIAFVGGEAVERRRPVHVAIFHAERAVGVEDDGAFVGRGPRDEPAHVCPVVPARDHELVGSACVRELMHQMEMGDRDGFCRDAPP